MVFLDSCSFFPYERDFVSCRVLKIEAYGSVEEGGDRRPTAYFQFRRFKDFEIRSRHPDGSMITNKLSENAHAPVDFCNEMEILRKPQELQRWLTCILFGMVEDTQNLIWQGLSTFGLEVAEEALRRGFTRVDFVLHVHEVVDFNYFDEWAVEEDETSMGMVPAAAFSIDRLKKTIIGPAKRTEEVCSICMNQFSVAEEVGEMPCTHNFHHECIVQWLQTSHFCPICRYEMPTETLQC